MKMSPKHTFALLITLLILGCISKEPALTLPSTQVLEYKGEKLSSIADFRENSIKGPQTVDIENYSLEIDGLVETPQSFTYDEVISRQSYKKVVTLHCVEGWSAKILWEGVLVSELIDSANVNEEANTVVFEAVDGYTTSLPLDYIKDKRIILAYKMNDATIIPERGYPFQLVAEDKWGYKWIKWVTAIHLIDNPDYKGYWESRGYNNDANQSGPIFEK